MASLLSVRPCARISSSSRNVHPSLRRHLHSRTALIAVRRPGRQLRSAQFILAALSKGDDLSTYPEYSKMLDSTTGEPVSLESFKGKRSVCLYFYPKAGTPGCTKQAQKFRDDHSKFGDLGADVFGISGDSIDELKNFQSNENLPFPLLSDNNDSLRKAFGIKSDLFGALPGRQTFVIGKDGVCLLSYNNQLGVEKHSVEALKALQAQA